MRKLCHPRDRIFLMTVIIGVLARPPKLISHAMGVVNLAETLCLLASLSMAR